MATILGINVWSMLVATLAQMAVGMLWYGPLFGKSWMHMMGFTAKTMKKMQLSAQKAMLLGLLSTLVATYVLANFVNLLGITTYVGAFQLTIWAWLGFCMTMNLGDYLWANKPFKMVLINSSYRLVALFVGIVILAYWH